MCLPAIITAVGSAGSAAGAMSTAQMISLGMSAAGTGLGAMASYQQSKVAQQAATNNATIAERQAQDALKRGEQDAQEAQRRAASIKSSQRATMAARGLDLGYGTAADLQDQTDFFGQVDAATARTNARKEAWAHRSQKANFQAEAASQKPWLSAGTTLLTGASQVADKWYSYTGR